MRIAELRSKGNLNATIEFGVRAAYVVEWGGHDQGQARGCGAKRGGRCDKGREEGSSEERKAAVRWARNVGPGLPAPGLQILRDPRRPVVKRGVK